MKRKITLLSLVVFYFGLQTIFGQIEKEVSSIRSNTLRTNKLLSTYRKTKRSVEGISLEGTEATFYSSKRGVKKIHAEMYGETYKAKADYYYADDGKLIFVYYEFNRYDTHIAMNPLPKIVTTEEKRLYFKDEKLIKKIITLFETMDNKELEELEESDKEILTLEKTFREALKE